MSLSRPARTHAAASPSRRRRTRLVATGAALTLAAGVGLGVLADRLVPLSTFTGAPTPTTPAAGAADAGPPTASATPSVPPATPTPTPLPDLHLTIGYAGDVLTHMPVLADTQGGQGDLSPLTQAARPWVAGVDLALCGMEVPVSPTGRPHGYPRFATLPGVVDSLAASGWDGCATASNHAWDQGLNGVVATADAMSANHMGYAGTSRTEAEAARPYQLYQFQRDGRTVTVAQLSTTYSLNGMSADPAWAVNLNDVQWVAEQARAARAAGADVVVLHSQLGAEYAQDPVAEQTTYAQAVADTGQVDVLFGAHPHVPQTNTLLSGGPGGRGMWVSYSAGNFISNQSEATIGVARSSVGLFVWVDVTVSEDGDGTRAARVDGLHWHPFTVDRLGGHRLVDLAAAHRGEVSTPTLPHAQIERRWEAVTSVINPDTYSDDVPQPSGDAPTTLPRS